MTIQPDLFADDRYSPPVRRSDPATSKQGADHVATKQSELANRMADAMRGRTLTANEAAALCVRQHGGNQESYRKRAKELVTAGRIVEVGTVRCTVTLNNATTYTAKEEP